MKEIKEPVKKTAYNGLQQKTTFLSPPSGGTSTSPDVEVVTIKGKKKIYSVFQWGKYWDEGQWTSFQYMMFQDKSGCIVEVASPRVTEAAIERCHKEAVDKFKEMMGWR
jgi:hypothetical protein